MSDGGRSVGRSVSEQQSRDALPPILTFGGETPLGRAVINATYLSKLSFPLTIQIHPSQPAAATLPALSCLLCPSAISWTKIKTGRRPAATCGMVLIGCHRQSRRRRRRRRRLKRDGCSQRARMRFPTSKPQENANGKGQRDRHSDVTEQKQNQRDGLTRIDSAQ